MSEMKITDQMIERAAESLAGGAKYFYEYPHTDADRDRFRYQAESVLGAALESLTVEVEPTRVAFTVHSRKSGKTQQMIDQLLDRANERGITVEIIEPVAPEWDYRRFLPSDSRLQSYQEYSSMPPLAEGWVAERRTVGEWEPVEPSEAE